MGSPSCAVVVVGGWSLAPAAGAHGFSFLCRGGGWWVVTCPSRWCSWVLLPVPWWWLVGGHLPQPLVLMGSPSCAVVVVGGWSLAPAAGAHGFSFLCRGGGWWVVTCPSRWCSWVLLPVPWWWLVGGHLPQPLVLMGSPSCAVVVVGGWSLAPAAGAHGFSFLCRGGGWWVVTCPSRWCSWVLLPVPWWWLVGGHLPQPLVLMGSPSCAVVVVGGWSLAPAAGA